jgi:membrane protease YdiL (CAAX protease family)
VPVRRVVRNPNGNDILLAAAIILATEAYIWLLHARAPWSVAIPIALTLLLWFRQSQTLESLGLRFSSFTLSFRQWSILWMVMAVIFLLFGWRILFHWKILERGVIYFIWCALQQLLYQSIVCTVMRKTVTPRWAAALVSALIFAVLHLPNPVLVPGTFAWGVLSFYLFENSPSVYGLALLQVMLSSLLMWSTPPRLHHLFRVGPAFYRIHRQS